MQNSIQYTVHSTQYTVCSMQYTKHPVSSIQYPVSSIQYTGYSIPYTVYSTVRCPCTWYCIQHTAYSTVGCPCSWYCIQYTAYSVQYRWMPLFVVLHTSIQYTVHTPVTCAYFSRRSSKGLKSCIPSDAPTVAEAPRNGRKVVYLAIARKAQPDGEPTTQPRYRGKTQSLILGTPTIQWLTSGIPAIQWLILVIPPIKWLDKKCHSHSYRNRRPKRA